MTQDIGWTLEATEDYVAYASVWIAFGMSLISLPWYSLQVHRKQCGWEVVYVAILETINYILIIVWGNNATFSWDLNVRGEVINAQFLRYAEWLITCPVLLIALSNLTGLKDDYNWRTMKLMSADQGTIICGASAAMTTGGSKIILFTVAVIYGLITFYTALEVYIEAFANVPPVAKKTVSTMTYMFFASWGCFPLFFLMGPEGFGHVNGSWSTILHSGADLFSKNLWGIYAWYLRIQVREYHRKKWFEEQERIKKGEQEFNVPKERRPELNVEEVGNLVSGNNESDDEQEVDPFYADYRRQRRRNRGKSLSDPDPPARGKGQPQPEPTFLTSPVPMVPVNTMAQAAPTSSLTPASPQHQLGSKPQGYMDPNSGGMNMMGGASPFQTFHSHASSANTMSNPAFSSTSVIVGDHMDHVGGSFLTNKMQQELSIQVSNVNSKDQLSQILNTGMKADAMFLLDGMISAADATSLTNAFRIPIVQFGTSHAPREMFGEAYFQLPSPGSPFNDSEFYLLVNRLRTNTLSRGSSMATGGANQMHGGASGFGGSPMMMNQGMNQMNQNQTSAPGASVDVLMAEMNALKQYLNSTSTN
eukprot:CAMPEP_0196570746 /NCGR_PEP_ID=MMETSP1081-20130531/901_1 /TAXON_ID=36882 /ORGANISM="Pyramimonas amylifera, Strain CCMP720" /LENGTH=589 /DNA_ID=CAMNT_0041887361 /DNA_START=224 /DNA_END=1993 /DNA_ORIENTATION=+